MSGHKKAVFLGSVKIGGGAAPVVQSMTSTQTHDIEATLEQIKRLFDAGCEVVRVAVPDQKALTALPEILKECPMPLVADIHFDYRLAIGAIEAGADGIRINPGNIGNEERVKRVIEAARKRNVPIRIGVNSGSLPREILDEFEKPGARAMVKTMEKHVSFFENNDYTNIKLSLKSTDVLETIAANREASKRFPYPLHLGLTEAGTLRRGIVNSAAALTPLLLDGIGDTLRISLTEDPVEEVRVAWDLLGALKIKRRGLNIFSCPTCGRCQIDLEGLVKQVEKETAGIEKKLDIAIMGCVVNGPGEAKEADLGIAGGKNKGVIFAKGKKLASYPYSELLPVLLKKIEEYDG